MRTNQAIAALKAKGYWKQDKTAKHYIEFSTILRRFLSERYGLYLMERTTYETVLLLKNTEHSTSNHLSYPRSTQRIRFDQIWKNECR